MVNAPRMMQEKRASIIAQIIASVEKARIEGKEVNFQKVVLATMANANLSKRTAREYVEVAFFKLNITK